MSNQAIVEAGILKEKSSVDMFDLPCGYFDEVTRIHHKSVVLLETTGEEHNLLDNYQIPYMRRLDAVFPGHQISRPS